jgi:hypothetical protein
MTEGQFRFAVSAIGLGFTFLFCVIVVPALIADGDLIGGFAAGFVNPYASGYSADVFACWFLLAAWVVFEASTKAVKYGWVCLVIGIIPGGVVGLAAYLLLRANQIQEIGREHA